MEQLPKVDISDPQSPRNLGMEQYLNELNNKFEKEKPKTDLLWEDLLFLEEQSICLRHVATHSRAAEEMKSGILLGDALALGNLRNIIPKEYYQGKQQFSMHEYYKMPVSLKHFTQFESPLTQEQQNVILESIKSVIQRFIKDSLLHTVHEYYQTNEENTPITLDSLSGLLYDTFLLIRRDDSVGGYDTEQYYGVGKIGSKSIPSSQIVGCTPQSQFLDNFQNIEELKTSTLDQDQISKILDIFADYKTNEVYTLIKQSH